jgi:hypothetical protein
MVCALLAAASLCVVAEPDLWYVRAEHGEYIVSSRSGGRALEVYREPVDNSEVNGPHGAILELWPSPDRKKFVFLHNTFVNSGSDPRYTTKLVLYLIGTKERVSIWADDLPELDDISSNAYFKWFGNDYYRYFVKRGEDIYMTMDTVLWDTDIVHRRTGYKDWNDLFKHLNKNKRFRYFDGAATSVSHDLGSDRKFHFVRHEGQGRIQIDDKLLFSVNEYSAIRESILYNERWLVITTYEQVTLGTASIPSLTSIGNYKFRSYLIDLDSKAIVFQNDAYLLRLAGVS